MEHRALATWLCLTCFACGLDGPEAPTALPAGDASADDAAVVVAPLHPPERTDTATAAPEVSEAPLDEPVLDDVPRAVPRAATPARLDVADPFSVHRVLPAASADGRLVLTARYEQASDSLFVDVVRASNRRRVRSIELPLSGTEAALHSALSSVDRMLTRRGFVTFRSIEPVIPQGDADHWAPLEEWKDGELTVHYDANTGGLAVYRGYALVHQSLVAARRPDGPGVGLMDPDYAELPMIPSAEDVRISGDGRLVAVQLAACDCSCDIEPFWKLVPL